MGCQRGGLVTRRIYSVDFIVVVVAFFLSVLLTTELVSTKKEEDRVWLVFVAVWASSLWLMAGRGCASAWLVARKLSACYLGLEMLFLLSDDAEKRPAGDATGE